MIDASPAPPARSISNRYTLLEKLGAGGQAEVWRARDESGGVEVALKILNPGLTKSDAAWAALVREHAIASRLDCPAILKVQPPYREGDFVALPMELASGGDLRRLRGKGYLEVVPVLIDIAQALEYAHEHGVIHRDLKPSNILFDSRGRVRIADFGTAGTPGETQPALTRPGLSPFTASPEQLRGEPPAVADDIYGLGALAYELLSGYPPYYPRFEVRRVLEEPVPELQPAQLMPAQLIAAIMRMLAKRAALRPRSMRDVIDAFDSALNDTLTFDFDRVEENEGGQTVGRRRDAAVIAAAGPSRGALTSIPGEAAAPGIEPKSAPLPQSPSSASRRASKLMNRDAQIADARKKRSDPPSSFRANPSRAQQIAAPASASAGEGGAIEGGSRADEITVEEHRIAAAAAAVRGAAPHLGTAKSSLPEWDDVRLRADPSPAYRRASRAGRRSWPWVLLTTLVAAAIVAFVVVPNYTLQSEPTESSPSAAAPTAPEAIPAAEPSEVASAQADDTPSGVGGSGSATPQGRPEARATTDTAIADRLAQTRAGFDQRLAALEARGAGFWGGADFATAKTRAAESVGANDAGSPRLAEQRLKEALRLLGTVEGRAAQALDTQLTTGDRALAAGQSEVAKQAYDFARRIDPTNRRAADGLQRVRNLGGVLPLLADAENAEAAKDYARAVQDYSQALSLDPANAKARAGLDRAHAGFGEDSYAKAVGSGFASLGAGRLDEARIAFEKARSLRPGGAEAVTGLARVGAALSARGFASTRQQGAALEAEERWSEAAAEYDAALKIDPSLVFAQQGRARALQRADLANSLQALIDRPERLASESVRSEADALLRRAQAQQSSGPVLRSQVARLQILLPEFDIPVRLELVSDNATEVQIQRVGSFGAFSKRQIELKPGKYTVVGTRPGFRDVRRDVTIAPGRDVQTISVSCVEPI
jgi:serine/threonine protein kinase/tetratricopeptide (TPR) repeat protein